jgi:hypothetical protein
MQAVLANASIKQDKSAVSFMGLLSKSDLLTAITAYKGVILKGILLRRRRCSNTAGDPV